MKKGLVIILAACIALNLYIKQRNTAHTEQEKETTEQSLIKKT